MIAIGVYKLKINQEPELLFNDYVSFVSEYKDGRLFSDTGITNTKIDKSKIQKWLTDPESYLDEITSYMMYMYITDGTIYQLYTLFQSLPRLNYRIKTFDKRIDYENDLINFNKILYKTRYKDIARDLLSQFCATGNVICVWLGEKKNPYLYTFNNLKYIFAPYREHGQWRALLDMTWLDEMTENERDTVLETFKSIKLRAHYDKYLLNKIEEQYFKLPINRTVVIKVNTIFRNQGIGLPMGIQALFDLKHKDSLEALEENIIDKIIKNIAMLTIGDKEHPYQKINSNMKKEVIAGVKHAIKQSVSAKGVPVTVLPNYARLDFPDPKGLEIFNDGADKFEDVNNTIQSSVGVNGTLTGSNNGSNYQSAKLSLDVLHSRIGVYLEKMDEIFQKLLIFSFGEKKMDNYAFEFVTGTPLSNKEELEIAQKLHSEGMSYKAIVDMLPNVEYFEFIEDSKYEIQEMKLRDVIVPAKTSSTLSTEGNETGRKSNENPENENTIKSQETGGNLLDGSTE